MHNTSNSAIYFHDKSLYIYNTLWEKHRLLSFLFQNALPPPVAPRIVMKEWYTVHPRLHCVPLLHERGPIAYIHVHMYNNLYYFTEEIFREYASAFGKVYILCRGLHEPYVHDKACCKCVYMCL